MTQNYSNDNILIYTESGKLYIPSSPKETGKNTMGRHDNTWKYKPRKGGKTVKRRKKRYRKKI